MAALVADYGSSSGSESDKDEQDKLEDSETNSKQETSVERLPLPSFTSQLSGASVFTNPYRQEEEARRAVLEKHVKLTTAPTELRHINGKQVCWNYRKGRCRFGRDCKFAHDSDLQRGEREEPAAALPSAELDRSATVQPGRLTERKRPGLSQTLTPGKKVMKMYNSSRKGPLV